MKQLTCEMCGSTDLVKQDGVFVCQSCGCKYSVEEAKKMMIEGTVEVQGTVEIAGAVQVDTSVELNNLYQIARRARDDNNTQNAAKYYDMIKIKDPTSWEASFYQVYFTAMSCKVAEIGASAIAMANCQSGVFSLIKDHVQDANDKEAAIREVVQRSEYIANALYNGSKNWLDGLSVKADYFQEHISNALAACNILYICGDRIETIFAEEPTLAAMAEDVWKAALLLRKEASDSYDTTMDKYAKKIEKYDAVYAKKYFYDKYSSEINKLSREAENFQKENKKGNKLVAGFGVLCLLVCLARLPQELSWYQSFGEFDTPLLELFLLGCGICCLATFYSTVKKGSDAAKEFERRLSEVIVKRDTYK